MKRMGHAREHLEFCVKLYRVQPSEGRHLFHEPSATASAWLEDETRTSLMEETVNKLVGDQCRYGL